MVVVVIGNGVNTGSAIVADMTAVAIAQVVVNNTGASYSGAYETCAVVTKDDHQSPVFRVKEPGRWRKQEENYR